MRSNIIKEAREWIGTPYHHQASLKYVGCDCVGFVVGVGIKSGFLNMTKKDVESYAGYGRTPNPKHMGRNLRRFLIEIDDPQIGDIAWIQWRKGMPMHLAIISEHNKMRTIIHAYRDVGKVVEQTIGNAYRDSFHSFWRYPGIEEWLQLHSKR